MNWEVTWTLNRRHLICWSHRHLTREKGKRSARIRKSVVSIGNMTRQTHLQAMIMISPMKVIKNLSNSKIRNIGKRIQSDYAQL